MLMVVSSSPALAEGKCESWRSVEILSLRDFLLRQEITLIGQNEEIIRLENQTKSVENELATNSFRVNAETQYSKAVNGLGTSTESDTKKSTYDLSLSAPFSIESSLLKKRLRLTLRKNNAYLSLLKIRQQSEVMSQLMTILNLHDLLDNAKTKLPIIKKQIDYYLLLKKIGSSNVQKLSQAELSKLKAENEIINLESKIEVELSKIDLDPTLMLPEFAKMPRMKFSVENSSKVICSFVDPERALKQLDVQISDLSVQLAKSKKMPTGSLSIGLGSTDYHSGAHSNDYSVGFSISAPLYAGGTINAGILEAESAHRLSILDLRVHRKKFQKKYSNFFSLESSLIRSIAQAKEQLNSNEAELAELIERGDAGSSVFADLTERQLQRIELHGILYDLENRLASFWSNYLENFIELEPVE
ncbi:TolC family protein [Alphaproteobacteria bacterium]|nr:TolC family protein [Alphaproteobacteria bacterium]